MFKWSGSHDQDSPPCPYMVKTLKDLLLQNQLTDDLGTWYVALCMWVLPRLYKLSPWVDLDLFYAKVKFGYIGFCMGKSENHVFFGNYCSHRPQSWFKYSNKWVNEVKWVPKVKVFLTLANGHSDIKIKSCFSQKLLSYLEPNFIWKLMGAWV